MLKLPQYLRRDYYCEELKRNIFLGYRKAPDSYLEVFVFDSETEKLLFPLSQAVKVDNNKYVPSGGTFCNPPEEYSWIYHFLEKYRIASDGYETINVDNCNLKLYRFEYSKMIDISLYTITEDGLEKTYYHPICFVIGVVFKTFSDKVYYYLSDRSIAKWAKILVPIDDGLKEVEVVSSKRYRPHEILPFEYDKMKRIDTKLNKLRIDASKDDFDGCVDYIPYDPNNN